MKIFSDLTASDETLTLLKRGVAPHQIVSPAKPAASVLSKSEPDPALADADIAFGQPDAGRSSGQETALAANLQRGLYSL